MQYVVPLARVGWSWIKWGMLLTKAQVKRPVHFYNKKTNNENQAPLLDNL